jgi:hypothetical protein
VSPGNVQVLALEAELTAGKAVVWNVMQPVVYDEKTKEIKKATLVKYAPVPKGSPIFGFLEGDAEAGVHVYEVPVLALVATGQGGGYVTVQAQAPTADGKGIETIAELIVEVGGAKPKPPAPPGRRTRPVPTSRTLTRPGREREPGPRAAVRAAFAKDSAAPAPGGGAKDVLTNLAVVYESSASLLEASSDPALSPKNIGDLVGRVAAAAKAKNVPPPPYLSAVRAEVDKFLGYYNLSAPMTGAVKTEIAAKYRTVAASIKEAAK